MALLPILKVPDKRLKRIAAPVEVFDEALGRFLDDLTETMYAGAGIGLAAMQVGDLRRAFVCDVAGKDEDSRLLEIVNPTITRREGSICFEEGCLSVPGVYEEVERAEKITLAYQDRAGAPQEIEADGLFAVCIQHELDHLNGVVLLDHMSSLKRKLALKKVQRLVALEKAEAASADE